MVRVAGLGERFPLPYAGPRVRRDGVTVTPRGVVLTDLESIVDCQ